MGADPLEVLAQRICADHGFLFVRACQQGAFKKTFHVQNQGADLALKICHRPPDPQRLQREIEALQACNHENICRLLELRSTVVDGAAVIYFLEDFISGGTLQDRLNANGPMNNADLRVLAIAISEALAHLAARRIVHRDVKPDNIMYRADGRPILVDLGIARHLDASSLTKTWANMGPGTPAYAAPEQLLNLKPMIDWRTDQFGLGVTLSIAGLNMHPYSGNLDFQEAFVRVAGRIQRPQAFIDAATARGLGALIKMTETWPVKRYARPEDLIEAWRQVKP